MTKCPYRQGLPTPIPEGIARLPLDDRGYPVPWFVAWIDGKPDFRVADQKKQHLCIVKKLCWVCGDPLKESAAFVIGPMCVINRVSAEPPSHIECAHWSARACPFLTLPSAKRREVNLPDIVVNPAGTMIRRNPGCCVVWQSGDYSRKRANGGYLWDVGTPRVLTWYAEGQLATRGQVLESIESGLPILREMAASEGPVSVAELERMRIEGMRLIPA